MVIDRVTLLLSLRTALLDAVPAELRAVTYGCEGEHVVLRFLFDGAIDPGDEEDLRIIGTEVISNFASPATIEEQFVRVDYPADLDAHGLQEWVYRRKESTAGGWPLPRSRLLKGG
jgi:hypothetical protein